MQTIYQNLVEYFGGQDAAAKALNVSQSNISGYTSGRWNMSAKVAIRAEKATEGKFKAFDLCPALKEFQSLSA
ncbi:MULTISPECIES: YdaS family helix-turn-helix protein [unclassified Acinetobacter]|uniref:YdaS family helix-turn-helix protein n=1 Tax=unclassified Acinetobacter TaxID=196816 RepID=UPI00190D285C|nr:MULTISPECIES: YdaS family helix-turn-helix protein [unclassified Acinetobacter]MBK0062176.1 helix-turn-helix domain-containing protein [Acinetobacter sp. S55]MBK0065980.1 helix-turn-helix domain-containing protein [Acinetobacter sp. S54]